MTEKKLKSATKKVTTSKASSRNSSAVSSKAKITKTTATAGEKKTAAKKPETAGAKKTAPKKSETVKAKAPPRTTAAMPAVNKIVPTKKPVAARRKSAPDERAAAKLTPEERYQMVQTAAYFIAERAGFQGRSDEHWAAAEHEIATRLGH